MASDLEEQKRLLLPILQRAEEIQAVEPRMAYYCRLYAIKKGLEIPKPTKEISGLIKATFLQCERDKPQIKPNPDQDRLYCENFALNVFRRADKVDRAGRGDMNTCKAFYAAAIFLQVLEQFLGPNDDPEVVAPDLCEKTRYALWRAAEIRKALREGRQPAPPPDIATGAAAGAAQAAAGGDLFAGPAYEQSQPDQFQPQPPQPPPQQPVGGSNIDSITSSTDEFLDLPKPPSTVPPEGSTGRLPPAAAAGPRFKPGSRVWCGAGGGPEEGTVGMVISPAGGPGGQAVYKVALRDRLEELIDSQLAPAVSAGARVLYIPAYGESPVPADVLAANVEQWPVTYLLQFDNGHNLDTDAGHITLAAPGSEGSGPPVQKQDIRSPRSSSGGGGYPSMTGSPGMPQPPGAPPLVDVHHKPQAAAGTPPKSPRAAAPPPPAAAGPGTGYPAIGPAGRQHAAAQPPAASVPSHPQPHSGQPTYPGYPPQQGGRGAGGYPGYPPPGASIGSPGSGRPPPAAAPAAAPPAQAAAYQMLQNPGASSFQPSPSAISEAQKYAKYAASSLAFDDVSGGVKYLTDALRLLTQPSGK